MLKHLGTMGNLFNKNRDAMSLENVITGKLNHDNFENSDEYSIDSLQ